MIDHDGQIPVALLVADLIDADPAQVRPPVHPHPGIRGDPSHDRPDRAPRDAHQRLHRALRRAHRQPRHLVIYA